MIVVHLSEKSTAAAEDAAPAATDAAAPADAEKKDA
jgi:hypothetical protein